MGVFERLNPVTYYLFYTFPMLDGEHLIIQSAIGGESSAFGLLYDHYQPQIYRFVAIKVGRREDVEDLTHQVFLSAWQNIKSYTHRGFPFSSWLYRIARNQIADFYRARRETFSFEEVDAELFAHDPKIELAAEHHAVTARVMQAIRSLPPEHQDVLIMRFVEDLAVRDVAEALGKSEGAVKVMQHRAVKSLKDILTNDLI